MSSSVGVYRTLITALLFALLSTGALLATADPAEAHKSSYCGHQAAREWVSGIPHLSGYLSKYNKTVSYNHWPYAVTYHHHRYYHQYYSFFSQSYIFEHNADKICASWT